MLVTSPLSKDESVLPSPEALKERILLKCKKLPRNDRESVELLPEESIEPEGSLDLCNTVKNGKMYMQQMSTSWDPYFFALTEEKLIYTEMEEHPDTADDDRRRSSNVTCYAHLKRQKIDSCCCCS
jgi:hypothetical protein